MAAALQKDRNDDDVHRLDAHGGTTPTQLAEKLRDELAAVADPSKAHAMQAYMKSSMPFLGVSAQPLRQVCASVFTAHPLASRHDWEEAVELLWNAASVREERYAAVALTGHRLYRQYQDVPALSLYRYLAETGAWWDYVDPIASHRVGPILRAHPRVVGPLMSTWARDDESMWVRRIAILSQLSSKASTDVGLLADTIEANTVGSTFGHEFFIRKAIGWALREYAKTDPDWVRDYVAANDLLSPLSRREALKRLTPVQPATDSPAERA